MYPGKKLGILASHNDPIVLLKATIHMNPNISPPFLVFSVILLGESLIITSKLLFIAPLNTQPLSSLTLTHSH